MAQDGSLQIDWARLPLVAIVARLSFLTKGDADARCAPGHASGRRPPTSPITRRSCQLGFATRQMFPLCFHFSVGRLLLPMMTARAPEPPEADTGCQ